MRETSSAERGAVRPLRALVLDFDGVIVESNDLKTDAFRKVFSRFPEHVETMMRYHTAHVSESRFLKFAYLADELLGRPGDADLQRELADSFSRATLDGLYECSLVPGAADFLRDFSRRVPLYLASVTPEEDLMKILRRRGLRHYFAGVYGCPPWTKTAAIRDVLDRTASSCVDVALIGDSPGDLVAAGEAGVEFIGRDSGIVFEPPPPPLHSDLTAIAAAIRDRI